MVQTSIEPYSMTKLCFELTVIADGLVLKGRDYIGWMPCASEDGKSIVYRRDPRVNGDVRSIREEIKYNLKHGLVPILLYPDGHEERLLSIEHAKKFIRQIKNLSPEEWLCNPQYAGLHAQTS